MKCFFAVLAALLVLSEVHADEGLVFMEKMVECGNEMGITPDQLKSLITSKDSKLGCVNACVMKKLGGMTSDGKLDRDGLVSVVQKNKDSFSNYEKLVKNLVNCFDEVTNGGDLSECDAAGKFVTCMQTSMI